MNSIDSELVSSTLPSQIYLVRRYYNVAATFVLNEYTAIFQKCVRDLTKRCCNVVKTLVMIHFQIFYIIWYNLPYIATQNIFWQTLLQGCCNVCPK